MLLEGSEHALTMKAETFEAGQSLIGEMGRMMTKATLLNK